MKLLQSIRNQGLAAPVLALALASACLTALLVVRVIHGCQVRHLYLIWNLFLAWLPLLFAVLAVERFHAVNHPRDRKFLALAVAWLLFFPNAPYIFTDVVHVAAHWRPSVWAELMLILLGALTGFLAGFLSLRAMHSLAARVWGQSGGWLFVALVSGLAGFGVYLGRFLRLNSWDVLNPARLFEGASASLWNLATQWPHTKFVILFSLFLLLGYVMLFALTHRPMSGDDVRRLHLGGEAGKG